MSNNLAFQSECTVINNNKHVFKLHFQNEIKCKVDLKYKQFFYSDVGKNANSANERWRMTRKSSGTKEWGGLMLEAEKLNNR